MGYIPPLPRLKGTIQREIEFDMRALAGREVIGRRVEVDEEDGTPEVKLRDLQHRYLVLEVLTIRYNTGWDGRSCPIVGYAYVVALVP